MHEHCMLMFFCTLRRYAYMWQEQQKKLSRSSSMALIMLRDKPEVKAAMASDAHSTDLPVF